MKNIFVEAIVRNNSAILQSFSFIPQTASEANFAFWLPW